MQAVHPLLPSLTIGGKIFTQLPSSVAQIQIVAQLMLTVFATALISYIFSESRWRWVVAILGILRAGWMAYTHLAQKDPIIEAMYQKVGGEGIYDRIPSFYLKEKKPLVEELLEWMKSPDLKQYLNCAYKAWTRDGRSILILKKSHGDEVKVTAFVEKLWFTDHAEMSMKERVKLALHHFLVMLTHKMHFKGYHWGSYHIVNYMEETLLEREPLVIRRPATRRRSEGKLAAKANF